MAVDGAPETAARETAADEATVAGVILAAGFSRRFGPFNKLVLPVDGEPMVRRVATVALEAGLAPVVVVTGHQADAVWTALEGLPVDFVHNPAAQTGLASSLVAGVRALPEAVVGAAILLADMPRVKSATVRVVAEALGLGAREPATREPGIREPGIGGTVSVPVHDGRRGNPVAWGRAHFGEILALEGDRGARDLLDRHPSCVVEVPVDDPGVLRDVDTLQAWEAEGREPRAAAPDSG